MIALRRMTTLSRRALPSGRYASINDSKDLSRPKRQTFNFLIYPTSRTVLKRQGLTSFTSSYVNLSCICMCSINETSTFTQSDKLPYVKEIFEFGRILGQETKQVKLCGVSYRSMKLENQVNRQRGKEKVAFAQEGKCDVLFVSTHITQNPKWMQGTRLPHI